MAFRAPLSSKDNFKSHWATGTTKDMAPVSKVWEKHGNVVTNIKKMLNFPNSVAVIASSKLTALTSKIKHVCLPYDKWL